VNCLRGERGTAWTAFPFFPFPFPNSRDEARADSETFRHSWEALDSRRSPVSFAQCRLPVHDHSDWISSLLGLFSESLFVLQGAEIDAMFGPDYAHFGYIPKLYETLQTDNVQRIAGDLALYGDQSIRLISTPGHTPGHIALLLRAAG
jgi:hypothetical protein